MHIRIDKENMIDMKKNALVNLPQQMPKKSPSKFCDPIILLPTD